MEVKYELAEKDSFDKFREACDTEEGWNLVFDDKKKFITVWEQSSKSAETTINMVRMKAHFPFSAVVMYDVLHDADFRKEWDENMDEGHCIQQLDAHNDVGYYAAKSPFFAIAARDFCNQRCWWESTDGNEYIIHNHSVIHSGCPEKKNYVRAWSHMTGYLVRPNPAQPGNCIMIYLTQTDLRGWIPAWAINQGASKFAPGLVDKLGKAGPMYEAWKAKHKPDEKPWISEDPYCWEKGEKEDKTDKKKKK